MSAPLMVMMKAFCLGSLKEIDLDSESAGRLNNAKIDVCELLCLDTGILKR